MRLRQPVQTELGSHREPLPRRPLRLGRNTRPPAEWAMASRDRPRSRWPLLRRGHHRDARPSPARCPRPTRSAECHSDRGSVGRPFPGRQPALIRCGRPRYRTGDVAPRDELRPANTSPVSRDARGARHIARRRCSDRNRQRFQLRSENGNGRACGATHLMA